MTPDGKHVVTGSFDNTIKVWNLDTGKEERTLEGHSNSVNSVAVTCTPTRSTSLMAIVFILPVVTWLWVTGRFCR